MQVSRTLEEAIGKGNLGAIYSAFYTIAHEDPNFSTGKFDETLAYVKGRHVPGLMQPYDGKPKKGAESWNEDYWAEVASDLVDNFCEERIAHLRQVGRKVYPITERKAAQSRNPGNLAGNGGKGYRGTAKGRHGVGNGYADPRSGHSDAGSVGKMREFLERLFGKGGSK